MELKWKDQHSRSSEEWHLLGAARVVSNKDHQQLCLSLGWVQAHEDRKVKNAAQIKMNINPLSLKSPLTSKPWSWFHQVVATAKQGTGRLGNVQQTHERTLGNLKHQETQHLSAFETKLVGRPWPTHSLHENGKPSFKETFPGRPKGTQAKQNPRRSESILERKQKKVAVTQLSIHGLVCSNRREYRPFSNGRCSSPKKVAINTRKSSGTSAFCPLRKRKVLKLPNNWSTSSWLCPDLRQVRAQPRTSPRDVRRFPIKTDLGLCSTVSH